MMNSLSPTTQQNIDAWLNNPELREWHGEINAWLEKGDKAALNDAFFTQIEFGTSGIRGKTGLGSARINSWTVGTATQGLADYIVSLGEAAKAKGVVIGSDTRLTSPEFVSLVTDTLTSNGIRVLRFARPPQVGMLSFAVRLHRAQAGIYISASHNPPTDNGLKIYWADGAQVLPPHDQAITAAVKAVKSVKKNNPTARLVTEINDDFDSVYRSRVLQESVYSGRSAHVVYSPFHGTGIHGVLPILREAGFTVTTVEAQMASDGNFPNVPGGVPNPQNRESNALTAEKVLEAGADLGISTDPDADRLGLVVPKAGTTVILDGNETAGLLAYFICLQLSIDKKLPSNGFLVRTMVTTPLLDAIAKDFGLKIYNDLPVGFKYIGETITAHEDFGDELFVFGGEESFGCLKGSYARDKDASSAALMAAEMVSWLKDNGRTVWDLFAEISRKYGYFLNDLHDIKFEGAAGFAKMTKLMASLRANPPTTLGEISVASSTDWAVRTEGQPTNVVILNLTNNGQIFVRPSGTEPKVKLYIALSGPDHAKLTDQAATLAESLKQLVDARINE